MKEQLKRVFNTNSKLSQNRTEKQIMPFKATVNWLLVIYDVIYSLVVLTEKLSFFKKQLQGFIISLINSRSQLLRLLFWQRLHTDMTKFNMFTFLDSVDHTIRTVLFLFYLFIYLFSY